MLIKQFFFAYCNLLLNFEVFQELDPFSLLVNQIWIFLNNCILGIQICMESIHFVKFLLHLLSCLILSKLPIPYLFESRLQWAQPLFNSLFQLSKQLISMLSLICNHGSHSLRLLPQKGKFVLLSISFREFLQWLAFLIPSYSLYQLTIPPCYRVAIPNSESPAPSISYFVPKDPSPSLPYMLYYLLINFIGEGLSFVLLCLGFPLYKENIFDGSYSLVLWMEHPL